MPQLFNRDDYECNELVTEAQAALSAGDPLRAEALANLVIHKQPANRDAISVHRPIDRRSMSLNVSRHVQYSQSPWSFIPCLMACAMVTWAAVSLAWYPAIAGMQHGFFRVVPIYNPNTLRYHHDSVLPYLLEPALLAALAVWLLVTAGRLFWQLCWARRSY